MTPDWCLNTDGIMVESTIQIEAIFENNIEKSSKKQEKQAL